jgi:hypothetical protein
MVTPECVTETEIESAYQASGNSLGWRFLYSPPAVLDGADVAFVGLNPGGDYESPEHPRFARSSGSAYETESWAGSPPGQSPLQRQVRALFRAIGAKPSAVLSGNLVPFRSPTFGSLVKQRQSVDFGRSLWQRVLTKVRPTLVITMGGDATKELASLLGAKPEIVCSLGWGSVMGARWNIGSGKMVSLPHLSRFRVIGRPASAEGLATLFGERWRP